MHEKNVYREDREEHEEDKTILIFFAFFAVK
jgi:hypothetical protein